MESGSRLSALCLLLCLGPGRRMPDSPGGHRGAGPGELRGGDALAPSSCRSRERQREGGRGLTRKVAVLAGGVTHFPGQLQALAWTLRCRSTCCPSYSWEALWRACARCRGCTTEAKPSSSQVRPPQPDRLRSTSVAAIGPLRRARAVCSPPQREGCPLLKQPASLTSSPAFLPLFYFPLTPTFLSIPPHPPFFFSFTGRLLIKVQQERGWQMAYSVSRGVQ